MDDIATWVNTLLPKQRPPLPRLLLLPVVVVIVTLLALGLYVQLAYNLAAPLFHGPSMTYVEGLGISLLIGLYTGVSLLLKEEK